MEPIASSKCPVCGVDTPHVHNLTEQGQYTKIQRLNAELSAAQAREVELVEALQNLLTQVQTWIAKNNEGVVTHWMPLPEPPRSER